MSASQLNSLQATNPLMYRLLLDQIKDRLARERADEQSQFKAINEQIVGAEIIYATPDRFFLHNPRNAKRFQVKVGDWQIAPF